MLRLTSLSLALVLVGCASGHGGQVEPRSPQTLTLADTHRDLAGASLSPFGGLGSGVRRIDAQGR